MSFPIMPRLSTRMREAVSMQNSIFFIAVFDQGRSETEKDTSVSL